MKAYALRIRRFDLPLLTLLNGGVVPEIDKKPTYLVVFIDNDGNTTRKIVTEREFLQNYNISEVRSPLVLALK